MTTTTIDWDDISTDEALSLCVGWPSGQKTKLRQVSVGEDVGNAFRDVIRSVLYDLVSRTAEPWTPDADLSPETYLVLPVDQLGPAPMLVSR